MEPGSRHARRPAFSTAAGRRGQAAAFEIGLSAIEGCVTAKFPPNCRQPKQEAMSLELAIQKFPKETKLKDGLRCKLRPLRKDDEKDFHKFFLAVPERERMFIKHRATEPGVIRDWCQNIDLGRNL